MKPTDKYFVITDEGSKRFSNRSVEVTQIKQKED